MMINCDFFQTGIIIRTYKLLEQCTATDNINCVCYLLNVRWQVYQKFVHHNYSDSAMSICATCMAIDEQFLLRIWWSFAKQVDTVLVALRVQWSTRTLRLVSSLGSSTKLRNIAAYIAVALWRLLASQLLPAAAADIILYCLSVSLRVLLFPTPFQDEKNQIMKSNVWLRMVSWSMTKFIHYCILIKKT